LSPAELLDAGLARLGFPVSTEQHERFHTYLSEIKMWNPTHGLVHATGADLVTRHVLDSAAGAPILLRELSPGSRIIDAGSGAGLPGVPLAILMPEHRFILVERSARRVGFLRNALAACRIRNATVSEEQIEDVDVRADAVTCRAYHPLTPDLLEVFTRVLKKDGFIAAYKGSLARIQTEVGWMTDSMKENLRVSIESIEVPGLDEERHMVVIRRGREV